MRFNTFYEAFSIFVFIGCNIPSYLLVWVQVQLRII